MGKLEDCVFVAHNVGFDYAFRAAFEAMTPRFDDQAVQCPAVQKGVSRPPPLRTWGALRRHGYPPHRPTPALGTPRRPQCSFTRSCLRTRPTAARRVEARPGAMDAPARARQEFDAPTNLGLLVHGRRRQAPLHRMSIHIQSGSHQAPPRFQAPNRCATCAA